MDEVAPVRAGRPADLRALVQVAAGAPTANLDRCSRVRDVIDVEAELVGRGRELGHGFGGVDPGVPLGGREPDLVRASRLRANEREAAWLRRMRDVVERAEDFLRGRITIVEKELRFRGLRIPIKHGALLRIPAARMIHELDGVVVGGVDEHDVRGIVRSRHVILEARLQRHNVAPGGVPRQRTTR